MRLDAVKILEFPITKNSKEDILEFLKKYLQKNSKFEIRNSKLGIKPLVIVTPNPEQIVYAQTDKHFARILKQADITIPDGIGVIWASRFLKIDRTLGRLPGIELMENLVETAATQGFRVGLIGGRRNLAVKTLDCLQKKYSGLVGWGEDGPEVEVRDHELRIMNYEAETAYFNQIAKRIVESDTRLVFVGLGAPKQEYFIDALRRQLSITNYQLPTILMAVGGSFDIITGQIPRAPNLFRQLGAEWLWRLWRESWRWKRQTALLQFAWLVAKRRLCI